MSVWAIGDLHLSFGCKDKKMDVFGPEWVDHHLRIQKSWDALVSPSDLVLIPGDISWAMHAEDALADLKWIDERPGCKVMIKGNHDYWWQAASKVRKILPPSIHIIYNDAFLWNDIAIGGTRLWDSYEYDFSSFIDFRPSERTKKSPVDNKEENEKIFIREIERLKLSISAMDKNAKKRIVMTHYPPISADLQPSRISQLMEQEKIDYVIFGHLHSLKKGLSLFGKKEGVTYTLTSCDYLNFDVLKILG